MEWRDQRKGVNYRKEGKTSVIKKPIFLYRIPQVYQVEYFVVYLKKNFRTGNLKPQPLLQFRLLSNLVIECHGSRRGKMPPDFLFYFLPFTSPMSYLPLLNQTSLLLKLRML